MSARLLRLPVAVAAVVMTNPEPTEASSSGSTNGMDAKLKHLEFIQAAIARMSTSSFLFKGWAITIAAGLSAFGAADTKSAIGVALGTAIVSTMLFWGLDGYYLWLERGFVKLHDTVAAKSEADIDFSMRIDKSKAVRRWLRTCFRHHLFFFYGTIIVLEVIGLSVIRSK
jgi:hypothetical protein